MATRITLDADQELYQLAHANGCSCFGFANARDHANQIADRLDRPELSFTKSDFGALRGYEKYLAAVKAWGNSKVSAHTYFAPGTDPKAASTLETCRTHATKVRLIMGNVETGESWLDEHHVVGRIGRSCGTLKVPLLVGTGANGGPAILTDCLLAIVEWATGAFLYRHHRFQPPKLLVQSSSHADYRWEVVKELQVVARFRRSAGADAYVRFMRGECVSPRNFQ